MVEQLRKNKLIDIPVYRMTRTELHKRYYHQFERMETWSKDEIAHWQLQQLRDIVLYAYCHVPFYRQLYDKNGLNYEMIEKMDDMHQVPIVTKADIKQYNDQFESDELVKLNFREDFTGGSTGQPMRFLVDSNRYYLDEAFYRYYWEKCGFNVGKDRCIVLRGKKISIGKENKIYEYNRFWKYLYLDSSCLEMINIKEIDYIIKRYHAEIMQAYPSSVYMLAKLYELSGIKPPKIKKIFLGSENIYLQQLDYVKDIFRVDHFYNQYGHSEKVLVAADLADEQTLAFPPNYGFIELVDNNNKLIGTSNVLGEIVGTGFSKSMPFIRYKTGDCAAWKESDCAGFMKYWKKTGYIEGRIQEFVFDSHKRKISICTIGGAHIAELNLVLDMQYEQYLPGELIIHVIENEQSPLGDNGKIRIEQAFTHLFNGDMKCKVSIEKKINRTDRNKKNMLVQHYCESTV